jgi:AraC-like DNA-binding protein
MMETQSLGIIGLFIVAMAGLLRFGMMQHRRLADQFVQFLERSFEQREGLTNRMMTTLETLSANVGENSNLLHRIMNQLRVA